MIELNWSPVVAQYEDCWVSFLGRVYNLTPLIKKNPGNRDPKLDSLVPSPPNLNRGVSPTGELSQPLADAAGQDISHWFDPATQDVRR